MTAAVMDDKKSAATATVTSNPLADAAHSYAEQQGWPVFPPHNIEDGRCSCPNAKCISPGKHPRTKNGVLDATTDPQQIERWWAKYPTANIGLATGEGSGIVVIDRDDYRGGAEALDAVCDSLGVTWPDTLTVKTAGGGYHYFFQYPDRPVGNKGLRHNGQGVTGVDVRGDGGYVVVEPSNHMSGQSYAWLDGGPGECSIAPMPDWLLNLIPHPTPKPPKPPPPNHHRRNGQALRPQGVLPSRVSELVSKRETTLCRRWQGDGQGLRDNSKSGIAASIVCSLVKHHISDEDIHTSLRVWGTLHGIENKTERGDWRTLTIETAKATVKSKTTTTTSASVTRLSDVEPQAVRWLWPGRIPTGKLTIIQGDPDTGKSFMTLDLAARVSAGLAWPDCTEKANMGNVILLSAEDDAADTIRPRLDAMGADVTKIVVLDSVTIHDDEGHTRQAEFTIEDHLGALDELATVENPRLIVIDPISAYMGGTDSHKNAEVRGLLKGLASLASKHDAAVVAVMHLNKTYGGKAVYRASGSLAFTAAARVVYMACHDQEDNPEREADRKKLFLPVKCNIAERPAGLAYRIATGPKLVWLDDVVTVTADDALAVDSHSPGPEPEARRDAEAFIVGYLTTNGITSATMLEDAAVGAGHGKRTFERARAELARTKLIHRERTGLVWYWRMNSTPPSSPTPGEHGEQGELGVLHQPTTPS